MNTFHRIRAAIATVASVVVLFLASLAPGLVHSGSALALIRVPLEAVLALVVLALLPWRAARWIVAALFAVVFVSASVSAGLDRGFTTTVGAPFNVVTGWPELSYAYGVLRDSTGSFAAGAILVLLLVVVAGCVVAIAASLLHLDAVIRRHRRRALIGAGAVTASWIVLGLLGAQLVPGEPVAASDSVRDGGDQGRTGERHGTRAGGVRQGGRCERQLLPAAGIQPAHRAERQRRDRRFHRELRPGGRAGNVVLPRGRCGAPAGEHRSRGSWLQRAQRVPHLVDVRGDQLAGPLHPPDRAVDRLAAEVRPGDQRKPVHPQRRLRQSRLADAQRRAIRYQAMVDRPHLLSFRHRAQRA